MGDIRPTKPVLLVLAAFSRDEAALRWARCRAEEAWGPTVLESERFAFDDTDYYRESMGAELIKVFWAFERLVDADALVQHKLTTNQWEADYAQIAAAGPPRPLNLDPGYVTEAKLVLASTKDRDHRIYLSQGIFAEVTLYYRAKQWQSRDWTYRDYASGRYDEFLTTCRNHLRHQLRG